MALTKLTADLNVIQTLDTLPNDVQGLTPAALKAKYDKGSNDIKTYINDVLTVETDNVLAGVVESSDAKYEAITDLTNNRKLSPSGDFTGTIAGMPITSTDPGLSIAFNTYKADNATDIKHPPSPLIGANGDGITDDVNSLNSIVSVSNLIFIPIADNYYLISSPILINNKSNCRIIGNGKKGIIKASCITALLFTGTVENIIFENIAFESTFVGIDTPNGIIVSDNANLTNVLFINCYLNGSLCGANGVKLVQETGMANGVMFERCKFENISRMGVEVQNHTVDGISRYKDIKIKDCTFKNIGASTDNGMAISLSGKGEGCDIDSNTFDECKTIGVEIVGASKSTISNNKFKGFTAPYNPISITGNTVMDGLIIKDNQELETGAGTTNIFSVKNAKIKGNILRSNFLYLKDVNDSIITTNSTLSDAVYALYVEGASINNKFIDNNFDTSDSIVNQATVRLYGVGVTGNEFNGNTIKGGITGFPVDELLGATGNKFASNKINGVIKDGYGNTLASEKLSTVKPIISGSTSSVTINFGAGNAWVPFIVKVICSSISAGQGVYGGFEKHILSSAISGVNAVNINNQDIMPALNGTVTITYGDNTMEITFASTNGAGPNLNHVWDVEVIGLSDNITIT